MAKDKKDLCEIYWCNEEGTTANGKKQVIQINGKTLKECFEYFLKVKNGN